MSALCFHIHANSFCRKPHKGAAWRSHCIGNKQLAAARKSFCLTVGSCSFAEPLDNLKALGLL